MSYIVLLVALLCPGRCRLSVKFSLARSSLENCKQEAVEVRRLTEIKEQ